MARGALAESSVRSGTTRYGYWEAPHPRTMSATWAAAAARAAAVAQVTLIVLGWGASQYPFLVVPELTLASASAPRATQVALLWALAAGAVLLFPSLYVLFRVFKGERPFSVVDRG